MVVVVLLLLLLPAETIPERGVLTMGAWAVESLQGPNADLGVCSSLGSRSRFLTFPLGRVNGTTVRRRRKIDRPSAARIPLISCDPGGGGKQVLAFPFHLLTICAMSVE